MMDFALDIHTIVCDFEVALMSSIKEQFPKAIILGTMILGLFILIS
jgi:hypothetical protein